jgi:hypothetical protein
VLAITTMIYTSTPLARLQTTSNNFKDRGNHNEAPGTVSSSRISVAVNFVDVRLSTLVAFLWAFTASFLLDRGIKILSPVNALVSKIDQHLFPAPPIAVSFPGGPSEDREAKLSALGFTKRSKNRRTYYEGPGSINTVQTLLQLGAESDSYTEYGTVNISGFVCLDVMTRVLHGALGFLGTWSRKDDWVIDKDSLEAAHSSWGEYAITDGSLSSTGTRKANSFLTSKPRFTRCFNRWRCPQGVLHQLPRSMWRMIF